MDITIKRPFESDTLFYRALQFAIFHHRGQTRSGASQVPYVNHCVEVARFVSGIARIQDPEVLAAAVLHDVVEDTPVSLGEVHNAFGARVADLVDKLTLPKAIHKDYVRKMEHQIAVMGEMNIDGIVIKIADKASNVGGMVTEPPKWGLKAIVGYAESSAAVVRAGERASTELPVRRIADYYHHSHAAMMQWLETSGRV